MDKAGTVRDIEQFYIELDAVLDSTDLPVALLKLSRLVGEPYQEQSIACAFDQYTGEANQFKWIATPHLWHGPVYAYKTPFGRALRDLIPVREIRGYELSDGEVLLITHVPQLVQDQGVTAAHFTFQWLNMLEL